MARSCGARSAARVVLAGAVALAASVLPVASSQAAIPAYTLVGQFALPGGTFDVLPDGRLLSVDVAGVIRRQDATNASSYSVVGSVDSSLLDQFGPSFLSVSPSGSFVAIGDGKFNAANRVYVFDTAALTGGAGANTAATTSVITPNFNAAWNGDATLYVTGAPSSNFVPLVNRIDLSTGASSATATKVIDQVGNGSGGVAIDANTGRLYTGIGFSFGADTGQIRSFALSSLSAATSSVNYSTGTFVADLLSAGPLDIDAFGNLLVGGGDGFSAAPDFGYAAVLDPVTNAVLQLAPAGVVSSYGVRYNTATGELLVTARGVAYRYAVPAPAAAGTLTLAGLYAARRRRRA